MFLHCAIQLSSSAKWRWETSTFTSIICFFCPTLSPCILLLRRKASQANPSFSDPMNMTNFVYSPKLCLDALINASSFQRFSSAWTWCICLISSEIFYKNPTLMVEISPTQHVHSRSSIGARNATGSWIMRNLFPPNPIGYKLTPFSTFPNRDVPNNEKNIILCITIMYGTPGDVVVLGYYWEKILPMKWFYYIISFLEIMIIFAEQSPGILLIDGAPNQECAAIPPLCWLFSSTHPPRIPI